MGRPREHDQHTAEALLDAAEHTVEQKGIAALSLRDLARDAGTTTRAVYSLFGSKDALLGALGTRAFDQLRRGLRELPPTSDPHAGLVEAALMFRRFALDHPALFAIGVQRADPTVWPLYRRAQLAAFSALCRRFEPLAAADLLGDRSVNEAVVQFHALCEGMAAVELRGTPLGLDPERLWREAVQALIAGFAAGRGSSRSTH